MRTGWKIALGVGAVVVGASMMRSRSARAATSSVVPVGWDFNNPPLPSWAEQLDPNYYLKIGATKSKNIAGLLIAAMEQDGRDEMPTEEEFAAFYQEVSDVMGVPVAIIRAHHMWETNEGSENLGLNDHSTALGLAQLPYETAASIGIPYILLAHWKTSVWATARYIKKRGWTKGPDWLPSQSEINAAEKLAGTDAEPSWYRSNRGYWGAYPIGHERFEKSKVRVRQRLETAISGKLTYSRENWNRILKPDRLKKFLSGTAKTINWKTA